MADKAYRVRAAHCDHLAADETVEAVIRRLTEPLERSWERLAAARTIAVKANMVWPPERVRRVDGRRQEHVDESVFRSVLRLLRERTTARLLVVDTSQEMGYLDARRDVNFHPILAEFGVEYVECNFPPVAAYEPPGGGLMFGRYRLHAALQEADEFVSIATLKSHAFMGVTLCTKNLFGLPPMHADQRPRAYFHHFIRLPYVLVDLARITQPCLNIIDGLVGQSGREWGGQARVTDTLVAGDHIIATDICAATLMGNDPTADWPTPPFRRDRNHLRIAAEDGFGPASVDEVDFVHDLSVPVGQFDSDATDPSEMVQQWRASMCEQALYYRDHLDEFGRRYPQQYILLQDGEVLWSGPQFRGFRSRRELAGLKKDRSILLKYVDPDEFEQERFGVYEQILAQMPEAVAV